MNDAELKKLLNEIGDEIIEGVKRDHDSRLAGQAPSKSAGLDTTQKVIGLILGIFAIIGTMGGVVHYVIQSDLREALEQPKRDIAEIRDDIGGLRKDLDHLRKDVYDIKVRMASDVFRPGTGASPQRIESQSQKLEKECFGEYPQTNPW